MPERSRDELTPHEATIRELFDTLNRVNFAEDLKQNAANPDVAMRSSALVRKVYFREAEARWPSFRDAVRPFSPEEVKPHLDALRDKEAALPKKEPRTLMDRFQAGGLFMTVYRDIDMEN